VLLLAAAALAIQVTGRDVPCPYGSGTARVFEEVAADTTGGWDSDLASYSSGGQYRAYAIATCTDNLFTVYGKDVAIAVPEASRPAVDAALAAAAAKVRDRKEPETWERYRIAGAVYAALGRDEIFLGDLYLSASWVARDEAVGLYQGLHGPVEARQLLDAGWAELRKPLSVADRKKVLYNLARIAHRGGWGAERDGFLAAFEAAGSLTPQEVTALAKFRRYAHVVEPELQDLALDHYVAALRGSLPHDEKVRVSYLTADLLRRRGRDVDALPLYFLVANDQQAPDQLRSLSLALAQPIAAVVDPPGGRGRK
jgi:hypothetical protein